MNRRNFLKLTGIAAICPKLPKPEPIYATGDASHTPSITCSSSQAIYYWYDFSNETYEAYALEPNQPIKTWKNGQWHDTNRKWTPPNHGFPAYAIEDSNGQRQLTLMETNHDTPI